jgi:NAD+ dependent glucose-6-phosphate dehydrogenase
MGIQPKILITGGSGVIGKILINALNKKYEITSVDLVPSKLEGAKSVVGNVTKLESLEGLLSGYDTVVHLAADVRSDADWESVYTKNILGTYNVYEAAKKSGVKKIVFASSNHVTGLYEKDWPISSIVKGDYKEIDPETIPMVSHLSPPRTDGFYGASKLFGESLGQYYSDEYGISVVCLRIGTVRSYPWPMPNEIRFYATWLSHRDLIQLFEKSIEIQGLKFDVFYGVSNNTWRFWDLTHSREVLGYEPQDNAEDHR